MTATESKHQTHSNEPEHGRGFNVTAWSIEHPYTIFAFFLAMVILAFVAIGFYMPKRLMPYVQSPMIGVVSMQPGLSAEEMETYISKPIEERMVDIRGVRFIRSTSQEGFSMVSLEFPYGTDMKRALVETQALMNVVQADLPVTGANLKPSWVLFIDPLNLPVLTFNLTAPGWDPVRLRELADNQITNRLKKVPDVWSIYAFGGYKRQLQVLVDRNKLAGFGLSILDVRDALDRQNIAKPAGRLTYKDGESIARINTLAQGVREVEDYPLKSIGDRIVYVKDVARVVDTYWEKRAAYHHVHSGKVEPGIEVSVIQTPEASSPVVIEGIKKEIAALEKDYPGIHFEISYDNSHFVGILMRNMLEELGTAIVLTGIAVLLFLGEWRATLISMITIPISLAMAVLALIPLGMTLDSSTLVGLLLSIGRLVDDSIIDIHAIERHLRMGKKPREATIDGITEVRLAVAASTLVLILALAPLLFCGGIVQQMFVGLVWPIIFGLLASFLVSLTLTAVLAEKFLRPKPQPGEQTSEVWLTRWLRTKVLEPFDHMLVRLEDNYARLVAWMLKHRFVNMARILATIVIGFTFYNFIGSEMMPLADVGQAYGVLEVSPGLSFDETEEITTRVEKLMLKHPEIEHVSTEIGTDPGGTYFNGYNMPAVNFATFMITLSDKDERKKTIWDVIDSVQTEATSTVPGIRRLQIKEMGSDVMASSQAPISILVTGPDMSILSRLAEQTAKIGQETFGMHQVSTDWSLSKPDWEIRVDPRRAQELGLTPTQIADQAYYSLTGALTNEYYRLPNIRQRTILVRYDEPQRRDQADLLLMTITTPEGKQVPLKSVANLEYREAPTVISHDQMRRAITVMGYYRKGEPPSMDVAMEVMMKAMAQLNWPPGYTIEIRGDMTQMMDAFGRLLMGLQLALLFIFLVLVAQFRGFLQPLQMVFSLPLELSGVFFALWLAHQAFSSVSIMAVIILTGMDITTAILLIDQILRHRHSGMPRDEAIIKACPERLRPILMTSVITIIVMLPVSIAPKTGMDAYSPLGTVVVGGLIVGTILSLLDIPIMHAYIDDLVIWLEKHFRRGKNND
ncbi:MAG: AcrB/AcrD/AcrF family protein [Candidatus Melainabacteria bacterium]|jgi:HAE1 family hydrophobic/amphiphilic exporter-1|nr:MAG: AcrB/AcrD/AcrF family protein [Candidatus Melainabacteria bacterium]